MEIIDRGPGRYGKAVHIKLDSEGYPIHPSEEAKFRNLNRIVKTDRWQAIFLVEARNSYGILPGPDYDLRANISRKKNGLFVVDFGMRTDEELAHINPKMYAAEGVIVPRRRREPVDTALGFKHNSVILDSVHIPQNAFDDIKAANAKEELPFFED